MRLAAVLVGVALVGTAILREAAIGFLPANTVALNDLGAPCCDGETRAQGSEAPTTPTGTEAGKCREDCLCLACGIDRRPAGALPAQLQTSPQPALQIICVVARLPIQRKSSSLQSPPDRAVALLGLTRKMRELRTVVLTT